MQILSYNQQGLLVGLLLAAGVGFLVLIGVAIRRRDSLLGGSLLLLLALVAAMIGFAIASPFTPAPLDGLASVGVVGGSLTVLAKKSVTGDQGLSAIPSLALTRT